MLVRRLQAINEAETERLSELLMDCVTGGASVGFLLPMSVVKATQYWRRVAADLARADRILLVGHDELGQIAGTVQVLLDQPENQPHRGDIAKMLVHPAARPYWYSTRRAPMPNVFTSDTAGSVVATFPDTP